VRDKITRRPPGLHEPEMQRPQPRLGP
jgi:hypothetical protein